MRRIGRQLAVRNAIENNLMRRRLSALDSILLRGPVQQDVQFRNFGDPTPVGLPVELDSELHGHSLPLSGSAARFRYRVRMTLYVMVHRSRAGVQR